MAEHALKTWPEPFLATRMGHKLFEVCRNDRGYQEGDVLLLQEWHPDTLTYTGETLRALVTYVLPGGQRGIHPRYCVLGLRLEETTP